MDGGLIQLPPAFVALDESWRTIAVGFLVEKFHRTGSRRTTEVYGSIVRRFLSGIEHPAAATPLEVHRFAYALISKGIQPSPSTVCVRLAAVSAFYNFACRMEVIHRNPAATVSRPQARQAPPRGLSIPEVVRLLGVIPESPMGLLDRALIVTALLTGLRRIELMNLHLVEGTPGRRARYEVRTKGGAVRRREFPEPAWQSILSAAALGTRIDLSGSPVFRISDATFYSHLRRYGEVAGLGRVSPHVLRHTAAKLRRQAGSTIEEVSGLLGHQSLATTATYLRRLEDEQDDGWIEVARAIGLAGLEPSANASDDETTTALQWRARPDRQARQGGWVDNRPVTLERSAHECSPSPARA